MTSFEIPTKPHVLKFLQTRYGRQHTITKKSAIGLILLQLLDGKIEKVNFDASDFPDRYTINVPEFYFNTKGFNISLRKRRVMAQYMEKMFMEDFKHYMDIEVGRGHNAMAGMRVYLKFYDISENDIKFETLYRTYQRYSNDTITSKKPKKK